ncbi:MAG: hypothetical protein C0624_02135 [Desulfuromonas sp.]|nr:MAG: hypothetical protein C0624_02135 [Desulfuromonas sp.]
MLQMERKDMPDTPLNPPDSSQPRALRAKRYYIVALGMFLAGLLFSLFIWHTSRKAFLKAETTRFDHYASMINTVIDEHLDDHVSILRGLRAFYNASEQVSLDEWQGYIRDLDISHHFYGTPVFAYVRYDRNSGQSVSPSASIRYDTSSPNRSSPEGPHDLFVVKYIEPFEPNRSYAELDLETIPAARAACVDSVENNQITLSDRIQLEQNNPSPPVFLLMLPVYNTGAELSTPGQRWRALQGWAITSIHIDKLLADIVEHLDTPLDIEIFDGSLEAPEFLFYDADGELHTLRTGEASAVDSHHLSSLTSLEIGGRKWLINILSLPGFTPQVGKNMPIALLVAGVLLSLLAALLVRNYGLHLDEAQLLAEKITTDLRRTEQHFHNMFRHHDAVMIQISSSEGIILDANQAASNFYGYRHDELVGKPVEKINTMPPEEVAKAREQAAAGIKHRFEFRHRLASGEVRDVEVHTSPMVQDDQLVLFSIIHDVTPRNQAQKALLESEERFRLLFETNPDPVVLARFDLGTVLDANRAFESACGLTREQTRGRPIEELGLWLDLKHLATFRSRIKDDGKVDNFEIDFRIEDEPRTGLLSARRLYLNQTDCILASLRDITLEKAAERSLQEMNRIKNEFISTAAHELRTPLSAIMGYSELLMSPEKFGEFSAEQKLDFIHEVHTHGASLTRLVDDLLDISRIESGKEIRMEFKEASLSELLTQTIKFFRIHDEQHLYRFELLGEGTEQPCVIDQHRIGQVLENLLGNALKFSPAGSEIFLTARKTSTEWILEVADQGIGMTPEQVGKMFDKFYRVDSSNTGSSGLGLGMSIVKKIIAMHNGTIEVDSALGAGTRIRVKLPCPGEDLA